MSKKPSIQWRESDNAELKRLAKNFNAKIRRLEKARPDLQGVLPERVKASDLKQNIETRSDFRIIERQLKAFTKKGAENVTDSVTRGKTTKWQAHEDKLALNRVVNRFNKKLDKVATIDNIDYLPTKLDKKEVRQNIKTPSDFKHFIERHTSFLKEGAENVVKSTRGAKATQWEVNEFYRNQEEENKRRKARLEELGKKEVTIAGEATGQTRARMGDIKENEVRPSNKNFNNMSMGDWERASRLFEKKMQSTYNEKASLNKLIHYSVGLESQGLGDVVELMKHVPLDKFLEVLDTDEVAKFDFIYDPIELQARREKLTQLWEKHVDETVTHKIEYYGVDKLGNQILLRL